jgi:hypothetical protein
MASFSVPAGRVFSCSCPSRFAPLFPRFARAQTIGFSFLGFSFLDFSFLDFSFIGKADMS